MVIIVIWFFLGIWFWLTVAAAKLGQMWMRASFPEKKWAGAAGAFIGFMLLMGGWWVYWGIEYLQVRAYVKEMCQQAGVKVYITPEEWTEMVGGEEAWRSIKLIDRSPAPDIQEKVIVFKHQEYKIFYQINERVSVYARYEGKPYILLTDWIYYDEFSNSVILQHIGTSAGTNSTDLIEGLKFWLDYLPSCQNYLELSKQENLYFFKP